MLEVRALDVSYGDAPALWGISMTVGAGELVAVVGPNGAGKTTLINSIARILPSRGGSIWLDGVEVTALPSQAMCELGVALIPEGRRLFVGMTVEENLEMGCYRPAARLHRVQGMERVYEIFPILKERRRQIAGTLSGGQQQMLAVGRALMARPKLLLVDEPSLGLSPLITQQLFEVLKKIHADGMSMLLIEQNVAIALDIAERVYVVEGGRIVSTGKPKDLLATRHIREAYLGEDVEAGSR
ncbi:MAG: ABC transporter ATP-binding protein [Betaproteobacteria bacterium]|nr:ABC transporter ATP-binding protein [Betaproteobacteria bacterium]